MKRKLCRIEVDIKYLSLSKTSRLQFKSTQPESRAHRSQALTTCF